MTCLRERMPPKLIGLLLVVLLPAQAVAHCDVAGSFGHRHAHHAAVSLSQPPVAAGLAMCFAARLSSRTEAAVCTLVQVLFTLPPGSEGKPVLAAPGLLPLSAADGPHLVEPMPIPETSSTAILERPIASAPLRI